MKKEKLRMQDAMAALNKMSGAERAGAEKILSIYWPKFKPAQSVAPEAQVEPEEDEIGDGDGDES